MSMPIRPLRDFLEELYRIVKLLRRYERQESLPQTASAPQGANVPPQNPAADKRRAEMVLSVLARAERPLKGAALAARAGVPYSSHLRRLLGEMVRDGRLIRGPQGGYWSAGRPLPEGR